jgi:hypothetical protein
MDSKATLKNNFNWNLLNKFSRAQQEIILEAGLALLSYLDQQTSGCGNAWMSRNIGKMNFYLGGLPQKVVSTANHGKPTSVTFLTNWIWLEPTFEQSGNPIQHVIHEIAHVIDNAIGSHQHAMLSIWFGHGPSDQLAKYLGGSPKGLRWQNGSCGIRRSCQWGKTDPDTQYGYGNHSTADYFAESISWAIINPSKIVQLPLRRWIHDFIQSAINVS